MNLTNEQLAAVLRQEAIDLRVSPDSTRDDLSDLLDEVARRLVPPLKSAPTGISVPLIAKLNNTAQWLESKCNPLEAARELRLIAAWIEGAAPESFDIAALRAPVREPWCEQCQGEHWPDDPSYHKTPQPAPADAKTMMIYYDPRYRAFWHVDCAATHSAPMRPIKHEDKRSLIQCVVCKQCGYYQVGGVGSMCVEIVDSTDEATAMKEHGIPTINGHHPPCDFYLKNDDKDCTCGATATKISAHGEQT